MKHRIISILVVICLLFGMMPTAFAAKMPDFSGNCTETITWELEPKEGILTISGEGEIPDYSYGVTAPWYPCRSRITKVVLSEGITAIGAYAFYACDQLVMADVSACTLSYVGEGAFEDCAALTSFFPNVPEEFSVGANAFSACTSLVDFQLGTAPEHPLASLRVGEEAFYSCTSLTVLRLQAAAGEIGRAAAAECTALYKVLLPDTCARLEPDTFRHCPRLTEISIPQGVCSIGRRCFSGCNALSTLTFPETLETVAPGAFAGCPAMTLGFYGDAPAFAAVGDPVPSFPVGSVITFPYDAEGWSWPSCKGYESNMRFPDPCETFRDLDVGAWYIPSVQHVYYTGLMNGVREGEFVPKNPMTRAQLVTVLYRLAGTPKTDAECVFTDVQEGAYYYSAMLWAQENKLVNGVTATTFGPGREITRQQLCVILFRYAGALGMPLNLRASLDSFTDTNLLSNYARDPMSWCVAMGFINGKPGGRLDPAGSATRVEIAKILTAFHTYLAKEKLAEYDGWEEAFKPQEEEPGIDRESHAYIYANEILKTINQMRSASGLKELTWSDRLYRAAEVRAQEISQTGFFGHTRPDGTGYATVFAEFEITSNTRNEIVAHGYDSAESLVSIWATASSTSPVLKAVVYSNAAVGVYHSEELNKDYFVLLVTG